MIKLTSKSVSRLLTIGLRLSSLGAKLVLMLYMGRYLSLDDMGTYGLVFGAVMVLTTVLGVRFDYAVSRDLVGATPTVALTKMRDQALFYLLNQIALAVIMIVVLLLGITGISWPVMAMIFMLASFESFANMSYSNMISLGKQLLANLLFFVRAGLWIVPVVVLGIVWPQFRTANTIFIAWGFGVAVSLVATLWAWREMPMRKMLRTSVDWSWIKRGVASCFFIWLGSLGENASSYIDRFAVAHNMEMSYVGIATFYTSFGIALYTLIHSGVLQFAYPKLIELHRAKNKKGFREEANSLALHVALFAGAIALAIAIAVPVLGYLFHRGELVTEVHTLWLILFGMWLRCNAETLYCILFARHQDRAYWLGDLLYLIPAFGANILLVPLIGFSGIGYSAIISAVFLLLWRGWYVYKGPQAGSHIGPISL